MLKAIAFGLATGAGVQALRHWPADGPVTQRGAWLVLLAAVVCAYLGGLWRGRGRGGAHASASAFASAKAAATSTAAATQTVNVAVVVPGQGAGSVAGAGMAGRDSLPWVAGAHRELTADDFEGVDVMELVEEREQESVW